jgi:hypothetical protein
MTFLKIKNFFFVQLFRVHYSYKDKDKLQGKEE